MAPPERDAQRGDASVDEAPDRMAHERGERGLRHSEDLNNARSSGDQGVTGSDARAEPSGSGAGSRTGRTGGAATWAGRRTATGSWGSKRWTP